MRTQPGGGTSVRGLIPAGWQAIPRTAIIRSPGTVLPGGVSRFDDHASAAAMVTYSLSVASR